jgi:hypothetical protein
MADNSQSTTLISSLSKMDPSNMIQQESKYLLTMISQKMTRKLYAIAIFSILIGIVSIGLDIGLMFCDQFR